MPRNTTHRVAWPPLIAHVSRIELGAHQQCAVSADEACVARSARPRASRRHLPTSRRIRARHATQHRRRAAPALPAQRLSGQVRVVSPWPPFAPTVLAVAVPRPLCPRVRQWRGRTHRRLCRCAPRGVVRARRRRAARSMPSARGGELACCRVKPWPALRVEGLVALEQLAADAALARRGARAPTDACAHHAHGAAPARGADGAPDTTPRPPQRARRARPACAPRAPPPRNRGAPRTPHTRRCPPPRQRHVPARAPHAPALSPPPALRPTGTGGAPSPCAVPVARARVRGGPPSDAYALWRGHRVDRSLQTGRNVQRSPAGTAATVFARAAPRVPARASCRGGGSRLGPPPCCKTGRPTGRPGERRVAARHSPPPPPPLGLRRGGGCACARVFRDCVRVQMAAVTRVAAVTAAAGGPPAAGRRRADGIAAWVRVREGNSRARAGRPGGPAAAATLTIPASPRPARADQARARRGVPRWLRAWRAMRYRGPRRGAFGR